MMLIEKIELLRNTLNTLVSENINDITSNNIVVLSQELDELITEYINNEVGNS
jgi:hypothetical protein